MRIQATRKTLKPVKGTEIRPGDVRWLGWNETAKVLSVKPGRLAAGAHFADVTTDDGRTERCWHGFVYRIEVDTLLDLTNATPAELLLIP